MFPKIYCRHDYWFGVAEAVRHFYSIWWRCKGKKAIVQGFGNVGSAAFYLKWVLK
jgi:glutamate dehydrogenase/leucine dehydrogenase